MVRGMQQPVIQRSGMLPWTNRRDPQTQAKPIRRPRGDRAAYDAAALLAGLVEREFQ